MTTSRVSDTGYNHQYNSHIMLLEDHYTRPVYKWELNVQKGNDWHKDGGLSSDLRKNNDSPSYELVNDPS